MTDRQLQNLTAAAIRHATLGRRFPAYEPLQDFGDRVKQRLAIITNDTGRAPTRTETAKIKAEEARRQRAAVAGFDLVFSPVKSAALLWALDERPHVRDAIRQAHEDALNEALGLVEDHAAYTRTGSGGIAQIATNGLIAAAFEHWDSRAGDPNLHTHVAVSSKVQGTDGRWRSMDARALYRLTVAVSEAYNTAFEAHLTRALGVTFTARPDTTGSREPVREITGVPFGMIDYFSRRRAAIEKRYAQLARDYRDQHGHDPPAATCHRLAQQATLATRQGKKPPRSLADKRAAWRADLDQQFGPGATARLMQAIPGRPPDRAAPGQPAAPSITLLTERAMAAVATRRSTWTAWNLRAEAERILRAETAAPDPGSHRQVIDAITALAISPQYSICVEAPALLDEPPELRRADGESVFTEHGAGRYTSQQVLDAEQRLLNATRTPTTCALSSSSVSAALDGFEAITSAALDDGQRSLVAAFACDERLLLAGIGPAGSGKTTVMRAYAHVLRQHGHRLVPLATSAAAADVLGRELSTRADNLHKFVHEWTAGKLAGRLRAGQSVPGDARMFTLRPGDVVLVDEAGMAGTFLLDQLVQIAAARGATVRLLGDDRQLPAIESGGALRLIASQPGTPELTVLHRFRDPTEATATLQLRIGDGTAVDWYASNNRIRAGSREQVTDAAYDGWKADMLAGKVTLMAAATNATITDLSARARADRVAADQVEPDGVDLHDGNQAGRGDWIVTRHNDRRMSTHGGRDWVKNGDAWHVERRHPDGSLTVRGMAHRGRVRLPADYVAQHVELLYATTTHRAQGATVDTAHPLITPGMTRENLYVLATRARERTTFYVPTHDLPFDEDDRVDQVRADPDAYAAREILLTIIATEGAPLSATETITTAQDEAGSLATLVPRYQHAARQQAEQRYRSAGIQALGNQDGADLEADPAWPQVALRLRDAEADGWDPARLLAAVAAQRELGTANTIAEVLAWRLDGYLADRQQPPPDGRPYESAASAKERLADVARSALGPQLSQRAQAELAWPALLAALRRAEHAGLDPAGLLSHLTSLGELLSARSISESLALQVSHHLAPRPGTRKAAEAGLPLPWMTTPDPGSSGSAAISQYLAVSAALITTRVAELADAAIRHRPPWAQALGRPPDDPADEHQWRGHVAVITAYREQFKITTTDPHQLLGPYPEPGHPGHKAYWQAAGSVLAARRLAGMDSTSRAATPDARVQAQLATDIYRALPVGERAAISGEMARSLGNMWFGNRAIPDEDAATQPAHAVALASRLIEHGHMTTQEPPLWQAATGESLESRLARRNPGRATRQAGSCASRQAPPSHPVLPVQGHTATPRGPQPRLG